MRTSLTIDDETYELVKEMAAAQGRTTANLLLYLIRTNNEVVGFRTFKTIEKFNASKDPAKVGA